MDYKRKISIAVSAVIFTSSMAFAQQSPIDGISFKLGDDVQAVKNALKTNIDPEPMESTTSNSFANPNSGKSVIFLRTKGIRIFFNKKNIVETIRFEPPFSGFIGGIKIGDSEKRLEILKGFR